MSWPDHDSPSVLEQYEALRREATELGPDRRRGHGLALFLTRGMPGWLAALTALTPTPRQSCGLTELRPEGRPTVLPSSRAALTTVLAGMVLACTRETEGR
jgi:hypothetical protein